MTRTARTVREMEQHLRAPPRVPVVGASKRSGPSCITILGVKAVIPPKANRKTQFDYDTHLYKERHLVECFINKLK